MTTWNLRNPLEYRAVRTTTLKPITEVRKAVSGKKIFQGPLSEPVASNSSCGLYGVHEQDDGEFVSYDNPPNSTRAVFGSPSKTRFVGGIKTDLSLIFFYEIIQGQDIRINFPELRELVTEEVQRAPWPGGILASGNDLRRYSLREEVKRMVDDVAYSIIYRLYDSEALVSHPRLQESETDLDALYAVLTNWPEGTYRNRTVSPKKSTSETPPTPASEPAPEPVRVVEVEKVVEKIVEIRIPEYCTASMDEAALLCFAGHECLGLTHLSGSDATIMVRFPLTDELQQTLRDGHPVTAEGTARLWKIRKDLMGEMQRVRQEVLSR